jgi:carbon storage regulator
MLVLTRKVGEKIIIADDIHVVVLSITGSSIRLGIVAPATVRVDRQEIHRRRLRTAARLARDSSPIVEMALVPQETPRG